MPLQRKWYWKGKGKIYNAVTGASLIQLGLQGKLPDDAEISINGQKWHRIALPFSQRNLSDTAVEKAFAKVFELCLEEEFFHKETILASHQWYMKPRITTEKPQGPFTTQRLLFYIREEKLKDRVCISSDGENWNCLGKIFSDRSMSKEKMESILVDLVESNSKVFIDFAEEPFSWKLLWGVPLVLIIISVSISLISGRETRQNTKEKSSTIHDKTKFSKKEQKIPITSKNDTIVAKTNRQDKSIEEKNSKISKDDTLDKSKKTEKTNPSIVKNTISESKEENPEEKPKIIEEKEKEKSEIIEESGPLQVNNSKEIAETLRDYYRYLQNAANELGRERDLLEAFALFEKRTKTLDQYFEQRELPLPPQEMRRENSERHTFFYPARLYMDSSNFIAAIDPIQKQNLKQKIASLRNQFQKIIQAEILKKQELQRLTTTQQFVEKSSKDLSLKLSNVEKEISSKEKDIKNAQKNIENDQSRMVSLSRKSLELSQKIRRVRKELDDKSLIITLPEMEWQKAKLELKLKRLLEKREQILEEIEKAQRQIHTDEEYVRRVKKEIEKQRLLLPVLQKEMKNYQERLKKLQEKIIFGKDQLKNYQKQLFPLRNLEMRQQELNQVLKQTQKWWSKTYPKPRANFLLSVFILRKFSSQYYKIKLLKNYGIGGVVRIYYW